ncbi:MAG: phosphoribosylglycinamide formyltransferase [Thermomicrobiales bacterium]
MSGNRIAVLASGSGTNLQSLLDACAAGSLDAAIVGVVSDHQSGALLRAVKARVPGHYLPVSDRTDAAERAAHDAKLADTLAGMRPDLVVLAGWMLLLGPVTLERFAGRIINVHPALLPEDAGDTVASSRGPVPAIRGARAVRDALRQGLPVTGATVHVVTAELDAGPVVLRQEVAIEPGDDESSLHERIKMVEHTLLPRAVAMVLAGTSAPGAAPGTSKESMMQGSAPLSLPVVLVLGSKADLGHADLIVTALNGFGIASEIRIASAHKVTRYLLDAIEEYERTGPPRIWVTIAGRSNALSGVVDANVRGPVLACPPYGDRFGGMDLLSSVRMPSGVAPMLVLEPEGAALAVAKILAVSDPGMADRVVAYQLLQQERVIADDRALRD